MKTLKKYKQLLFILMSIIFSSLLISCANPLDSFQNNNNNTTTEDPNANSPDSAQNPSNPSNPTRPNPNNPTTNPDLPEIKNPNDSTQISVQKGECTQESISLLSCFSCQTTSQSLLPKISAKAEKLLQIMKVSCALRFDSDPKDYTPPSSEHLWSLLHQASSTDYPDTLTSTQQNELFKNLINNDVKSLSDLFSPPFFDPMLNIPFETYFGITPKEARALFCYQNPLGTFNQQQVKTMSSLSYRNCKIGKFPSSCRESQSYITANNYRQQLQKSIVKSLNTHLDLNATVATNKCQWEIIYGVYNDYIEGKIIDFKIRGYEVALQFYDPQAPQCGKLEDLQKDPKGVVKVAAKICTPVTASP